MNHLRRPARILLGATAALGLLAACGGDDSGGTDTAGAIVVESSNTACTPAQTSVPAGTVKFAVRNTGSSATELYVYQGDKVLGEVENVGPGTTRTLSVKVSAGGDDYSLVCKPGQKGDGIKVPFTVNA